LGAAETDDCRNEDDSVQMIKEHLRQLGGALLFCTFTSFTKSYTVFNSISWPVVIFCGCILLPATRSFQQESELAEWFVNGGFKQSNKKSDHLARMS
jgi:hypothetical protein